jgi:uncharacterized C2H2 Zn-finger protein
MVLGVMSSDRSSGEAAVRCERCGALTDLATLVQPLGDAAGAQVHRCPVCQHLTWVEWWGWHGRSSNGPQLHRQDESDHGKK